MNNIKKKFKKDEIKDRWNEVYINGRIASNIYLDVKENLNMRKFLFKPHY